MNTNRVRLRHERRQMLRWDTSSPSRALSAGRRVGSGGARGQPRAHALGVPGGALVAHAVAVLVHLQQELGHRAPEARLRVEPVRRHQRLQLLRVYECTRRVSRRSIQGFLRALIVQTHREAIGRAALFALFYGLLMYGLLFDLNSSDCV